jgi:archaellum component FlaG (FlaF/FlaG flagellin family)
MPSAWTLSRIEAVIFIATVLLTASAGTWLSVGADRVSPAGRYPDSRSSTRATCVAVQEPLAACGRDTLLIEDGP